MYTIQSAALGRVCMKLVVVMGVTWLFDVLSWAYNVWISEEQNSVKSSNSIAHDVRYYFWYVMDAINALQGVLIFLVVVSQPQVNLIQPFTNFVNNISILNNFFHSSPFKCKVNCEIGKIINQL